MAASLDELKIDRSRGGRPRFVGIIWAVAVLAVLSGGGAAGSHWWEEAQQAVDKGRS